jgi:hypothetical protein
MKFALTRKRVEFRLQGDDAWGKTRRRRRSGGADAVAEIGNGEGKGAQVERPALADEPAGAGDPRADALDPRLDPPAIRGIGHLLVRVS